MELNLKHKAKAVIDYLYHQLFNEPAYNPSSASHTTACVNSYAPTKSDPWDAQGQYSNDEIGEWAATAHDKVVAVASSASNAVSNAAANLIDSTQTDGNEHGEGSSFPSFWGESQSKDQYHLLERAQSSLGPSTAWSDFAGSHAPRLHELQSQWGLHGLADRFGVEPYIVLLVLLLPIVVLLLSVCAMMGAGHPNEEPHHDYRHENMAEPSKVRGKEDRKSSSSSKQADGTSPRSYAGAVKQGIDRKGPMADGAKAESHGNQEQEQLGNGGRRSSWAAMIGSAGLVPTESPEHHDLVSETHGKGKLCYSIRCPTKVQSFGSWPKPL
ncbi:hypothetical protein BC939DRAFT_105453 [Gamsiella multidivaricata]|uniref:uncharacterized protein n=1 Tax=Gamsiella multidivaricata TaxID=101098 RepID=UPI0022209463|nr:uncharacterized protein BC939DRAFT_105453 [Gamsiella multidivaricata]KAI7832488.1 hypothetical protein BC939DRAFT_105453 [Gamsiella multidivaricata]